MVLVALDHAHGAVEVRRLPRRLVAQRRVGVVAHPVRLDVRLVDDVEAVLVGEVVPARVVGVVAGPHAVHVRLLHQLDVAAHRGLGDVAARRRIVLVAVHAPEDDGDVVHQQQPALHLHPPEAHALGDDLRGVAARVQQGEHHRVELRRLGRPPRGRGDLGAQRDACVSARRRPLALSACARERRAQDGAAVGPEEERADAHRLGAPRPAGGERHVHRAACRAAACCRGRDAPSSRGCASPARR